MADDTKRQISVHLEEALIEQTGGRGARDQIGERGDRLPASAFIRAAIGRWGRAMSAPLHRSLTAEARRALRSLNSEMLWRLRKSLEQAKPAEPVT